VLDDAELEAIGRVSARHNAARGLTGLLLYGGGRFYGVLEGPRRRVFARMELIITDPRHREVQIIREEDVPGLRFANWSFGRMPDVEDGGAGAGLESFILGLAGRF